MKTIALALTLLAFTVSAHAGDPKCENLTNIVAKAYSCGINSDGQVCCWGNGGSASSAANTYLSLGPAGSSTANDRNIVPLPSKASGVEIASYTTCAVTDPGEVYCWGYNGDGKAAPGGASKIGEPVRIDLLGRRASRLAMGTAASCAFLEGGDIVCWGGYYGVPIETLKKTEGFKGTRNGVTVFGFNDPIVQVAIGTYHGCALTETGKVHCWGGWYYNGNVRLDAIELGENRIIQLADDEESYSACGLTTEGKVLCWGNNGDGQLAGPGDSFSMTPRLIPFPEGVRIQSIQSRYNSNWALAETGDLYAWGTLDSLFSKQLPKVLYRRVVSIRTAGKHVCMKRDDGSLACVGASSDSPYQSSQQVLESIFNSDRGNLMGGIGVTVGSFRPQILAATLRSLETAAPKFESDALGKMADAIDEVGITKLRWRGNYSEIGPATAYLFAVRALKPVLEGVDSQFWKERVLARFDLETREQLKTLGFDPTKDLLLGNQPLTQVALRFSLAAIEAIGRGFSPTTSRELRDSLACSLVAAGLEEPTLDPTFVGPILKQKPQACDRHGAVAGFVKALEKHQAEIDKLVENDRTRGVATMLRMMQEYLREEG